MKTVAFQSAKSFCDQKTNKQRWNIPIATNESICILHANNWYDYDDHGTTQHRNKVTTANMDDIRFFNPSISMHADMSLFAVYLCDSTKCGSIFYRCKFNANLSHPHVYLYSRMFVLFVVVFFFCFALDYSSIRFHDEWFIIRYMGVLNSYFSTFEVSILWSTYIFTVSLSLFDKCQFIHCRHCNLHKLFPFFDSKKKEEEQNYAW